MCDDTSKILPETRKRQKFNHHIGSAMDLAVNHEYYKGVLIYVKKKSQREPELERDNSWFIPTRQFCAKSQLTLLPRPFYFPNLAPIDFSYFINGNQC